MRVKFSTVFISLGISYLAGLFRFISILFICRSNLLSRSPITSVYTFFKQNEIHEVNQNGGFFPVPPNKWRRRGITIDLKFFMLTSCQTSLFNVFSFMAFLRDIWILPINSPKLLDHKNTKLRHCGNQIMLGCWKWWLHYFVELWWQCHERF